MAHCKAAVRAGVYYDSSVLMALQRSLASLPGVIDVGVMMATEANRRILAQSGLLTEEASNAGANDLVIAVRTENEAAAVAAIGQVDTLLSLRRPETEVEYRPKGIDSAVRALPQARWVLVSVPGRFAAGVARQALALGRNVFLFSDNVSLEDEIALKRSAVASGLLVMGPDCGTAIVGAIGLGFANRVRRGSVGLVGASGTGLQQVACRVHQMGGGISHVLGTGGRDLRLEVGAATARQALDLLGRDQSTSVIVLISKPPARPVADSLLAAAQQVGKPVVVDFIGMGEPARPLGNVRFVSTFDEAAALALELAAGGNGHAAAPPCRVAGIPPAGRFAPGQCYLRGLFSGGSLAYEAQLVLAGYLPHVKSNAPLCRDRRLVDSLRSEGHAVIDLGEDEFTVGRLHPMMDNDLRIRRLLQEAADPEVAVVLLDVVLGYGAHADPASELAPAISRARMIADEAGRNLEVVAVVVGTEDDPQDLARQVEQLQAAGALVKTSNEEAVRHAALLVQMLEGLAMPGAETLPASVSGPEIWPEAAPVEAPSQVWGPAVDLAQIAEPLAAINVGLESFAASVRAQGAPVVHVDWRPPAGGDERLTAILERMRRGSR